MGLLMLTIIICIYTNIYVVEYENYTSMYQCIAGFGLGGSIVALFGRVSGGIFSKSVEVGCDTIGRFDENFKY
jgi:inorganic pyrophosphatase